MCVCVCFFLQHPSTDPPLIQSLSLSELTKQLKGGSLSPEEVFYSYMEKVKPLSLLHATLTQHRQTYKQPYKCLSDWTSTGLSQCCQTEALLHLRPLLPVIFNLLTLAWANNFTVNVVWRQSLALFLWQSDPWTCVWVTVRLLIQQLKSTGLEDNMTSYHPPPPSSSSPLQSVIPLLVVRDRVILQWG